MTKRTFSIWAGSEFMGKASAPGERAALERWCAKAGHGTPEAFCERFAYLPGEFRAVP